ncbi:hypothetical protein M427DRAFT_47055 [Gonapodya prolifera JEL478]|uniref:Uncharacterized protein n=1 Tax=Gonapodya prolifera (strain JEL478) TaxID=1344416 RepID=A0A139A569_GONPJ|nr:hypothetical protein M427DRAFT_47055 [Gonapodya prolifera JEL478]|eukprot:KXS11533.1 hypothetical protein M427DRAFT_47055 [Gonapodya prolifera JEL478]
MSTVVTPLSLTGVGADDLPVSCRDVAQSIHHVENKLVQIHYHSSCKSYRRPSDTRPHHIAEQPPRVTAPQHADAIGVLVKIKDNFDPNFERNAAKGVECDAGECVPSAADAWEGRKNGERSGEQEDVRQDFRG